MRSAAGAVACEAVVYDEVEADRTVASLMLTATGPTPISRTCNWGAFPLCPVGASEGMAATQVRV